MASLPDSARTVLESAALAHLVTLNPDGSPQVTVVWVGLDGDEIVAAHLPEHRKIRNIRNDARVALSLETLQRNPIGLTEYLVIYGTARVTEGGAAEVLQRLAHTYLGPDVKFPPMDNPPAWRHHAHRRGPHRRRGALGILSTSGPGSADAAALRTRLRHVYWIGGGSGAGKSVIARRAIEIDTTMTEDDLDEQVMVAFGL